MKFARARDVPDVLGFADYAAEPDLTYRLVRHRLDARICFVDRAMYPLPKQVIGKVRSITVLNPLDELALRAYVGRCSGAVASATDERFVLNGLIRRPGPGWFSADFKEQSRCRRELQREFYARDSTQAVGFFDVENFFPSCVHDELERLLLEEGAPLGAVGVLRRLLGMLFDSGRGLPIGFEGSGPLANLFLGGVDRLLLRESLPFVRWTDDLDTFLDNGEQWERIYGLVAEALASVRLRLNDEKTVMLEKGPLAEGRLLDPGRDSLFGDADAPTKIRDRLATDLWLREYGMEDDLPPAHFRSYLGKLRAACDPGALDYLRETPEWIDREPRSVADYLSALADGPATRRLLDIEWLLDRAIGRTPQKLTAAGQLHLCRVLESVRLGKEAARKVFDFAWRGDVLKSHAPLGAWAVKAWSRSQAWNPADTFDLIESVGHDGYRRAGVSGFMGHHSASALMKARLLARRYPEIEPALKMAIAA